VSGDPDTRERKQQSDVWQLVYLRFNSLEDEMGSETNRLIVTKAAQTVTPGHSTFFMPTDIAGLLLSGWMWLVASLLANAPSTAAYEQGKL
jgi:hypothetical protein